MLLIVAIERTYRVRIKWFLVVRCFNGADNTQDWESTAHAHHCNCSKVLVATYYAKHLAKKTDSFYTFQIWSCTFLSKREFWMKMHWYMMLVSRNKFLVGSLMLLITVTFGTSITNMTLYGTWSISATGLRKCSLQTYESFQSYIWAKVLTIKMWGLIC